MIPVTEFQKRALIGPPILKRHQFTLSFAHKVREIVAKYGIKYNPEFLIGDDATGELVFQAGADLLAEIGLYHTETHRVVQFSRQDISEIAKDAWEGPRQVIFGKGKDKVVVKARDPGDPRQPITFVSAGTPVSREELYIPYLLSFARESVCDGLYGHPLFMVHGIENKAGTIGEAAAAIAEIKYNKEIARMVGKPDMFLGLPGTNTITPSALITCCSVTELEPHQTQIPIHIMPEQQINWTRLQLAYYAEQKGFVPFTNAIGIVGAVCRGPEEAAVACMANLIAQLGYGHGNIGGILIVDHTATRSSRETLWAAAVTHRATAQHLGIPMGQTNVQSKAGACTEMALYEKAAEVLMLLGCGAGWYLAGGCRNGRGADTSSGMEARFIGEVAHAVAPLKPKEANALLDKVLKLYEDQLENAPEGKTFPQCYDVKTITPIPEYVSVYNRAKETLAKLGMNLK